MEGRVEWGGWMWRVLCSRGPSSSSPLPSRRPVIKGALSVGLTGLEVEWGGRGWGGGAAVSLGRYLLGLLWISCCLLHSLSLPLILSRLGGLCPRSSSSSSTLPPQKTDGRKSPPLPSGRPEGQESAFYIILALLTTSTELHVVMVFFKAVSR